MSDLPNQLYDMATGDSPLDLVDGSLLVVISNLLARNGISDLDQLKARLETKTAQKEDQ